jgi:catechol-2,3-dioxygenase
MTSLTGFSHVVLTVQDLDRSVAFYEKALAASTVVRSRVDVYGFEVAYLAEPTSGLLIGLTQHDNATPGSFNAKVTGLDHISFAVDSRERLEAWAEHLDGQGISHNGLADQPFGTGLELKDPDGIALEFYHLVMPAGI